MAMSSKPTSDKSRPAFSAAEAVYRAVDSLDKEQARVVGLGAESSAAVIGAPGTGKTTALIEYVASRFEVHGLTPAQIMVLSPTRTSATLLRQALAERTRIASNGPLARTPMSWAFSLASDAARDAGHDSPRLFTGADEDAFLSEVLARSTDATFWPEGLSEQVRESTVFRTELRDLIARAIELGLDPAGLAERAQTDARPEWLAVAEFWHGYYQPALAAEHPGFFDSSTIVAKAVAALAAGAAPEIKVVVVDDAQELTLGAIAMLTQLSARKVAIVLFGNPDQAVTTFRGAQPEFLGSFRARFDESAAEVFLPTVHRHGANITGAVDKLTPGVGVVGTVGHRNAVAALDAPLGDVDVIEAASRPSEIQRVARRLRKHHVGGKIPYRKMAVVVRNGSLISEVSRLLAVAEVPTKTTQSDVALRERDVVRTMLLLVRYALTGEIAFSADGLGVSDIMTSEFAGLTVIEVRRIRQVLRHAELLEGGRRSSEVLLADALTKPGGFADIDTHYGRRAAKLAAVLATLREQAAHGATAEELLWALWSQTDPVTDWASDAQRHGVIADEANRKLNAVVALFSSAKRFAERDNDLPALSFIDGMLNANVPEDSLASQAELDAVVVTTPAGVIGAEYEVVAVVAVQDGVWPNLRLRGSLLHAPELTTPLAQHENPVAAIRSDELRMFIQAISRARTHLIVTATEAGEHLSSPFIRSLATYYPPSEADELADDVPFSLRGMSGYYRRALTEAIGQHGVDSDEARAAAAAVAKLAQTKVAGANPERWLGRLEPSTPLPVADLDGEAGEKMSVSPSKLEKWEDNQLEWFISSTVGSESTMYTGIGTLLHAVFNDFAESPTAAITQDALWASVEPHLSDLEIESEWERKRTEKRVLDMCGTLAKYMTTINESDITIVGTEVSFAVDVEHGRLTGRVDRLEGLPDGSIQVIDLKTAKTPKADGYATENLQLASYQYALMTGGFTIVDGKAVEPENWADAGNGTPQTTAGAMLLYLNDVKKGVVNYKIASQPAMEFTGEPEKGHTAETFLALLEQAVIGMASGTYRARVFAQAQKGKSETAWDRRIHLIPVVTA